MPEPTRLSIPSYRAVFGAERRLHRLGDLRIPLPYGLPLAGLGCFSVSLAVCLALRHLPITGVLFSRIPLAVAAILLPGVATLVLLRLRPDGRPAWRLLRSVARAGLGSRRLAGLRRRPGRPGPIRIPDVRLASVGGPQLPRASLARPTRRRLTRVRLPRRRGARGRRRVGRPVPATAAEPALVLGYPVRVWTVGETVHVQQTGSEPLAAGARVAPRPGQRVVLRGAV